MSTAIESSTVWACVKDTDNFSERSFTDQAINANQTCQDPDCISLMHRLKQSKARNLLLENKVRDLEDDVANRDSHILMLKKQLDFQLSKQNCGQSFNMDTISKCSDSDKDILLDLTAYNTTDDTI